MMLRLHVSAEVGRLARRRVVGGADEAEDEGESEARHLLSCDRVRRVSAVAEPRARHVRPEDAISSRKPLKV